MQWLVLAGVGAGLLAMLFPTGEGAGEPEAALERTCAGLNEFAEAGHIEKIQQEIRWVLGSLLALICTWRNPLPHTESNLRHSCLSAKQRQRKLTTGMRTGLGYSTYWRCSTDEAL